MAFKLCAILLGGMRLMIDRAASIGSRFGCSGAAASSAPTISAIVGGGAAASVWRPRMPRRSGSLRRASWLALLGWEFARHEERGNPESFSAVAK